LYRTSYCVEIARIVIRKLLENYVVMTSEMLYSVFSAKKYRSVIEEVTRGGIVVKYIYFSLIMAKRVLRFAQIALIGISITRLIIDDNVRKIESYVVIITNICKTILQLYIL
jgi:hypothetical protein